jgi:hypothetical protein
MRVLTQTTNLGIDNSKDEPDEDSSNGNTEEDPEDIQVDNIMSSNDDA